MFCSQCGKEYRESERFCSACGHEVGKKADDKNEDRFLRKRGSSTLLYQSKGYPQAYYRRVRISAVLAMVGGGIFALLSQARHHSSQMNIYANDTLIHSGVLGGGNVFTTEEQELLLMMGVFFIASGLICLVLVQKQKDAYALMLYEDRIEGIKGFKKFMLEYERVSEVLTETASIYQAVTIVTSGNKYRIIVDHDAETAAEIIQMQRRSVKA